MQDKLHFKISSALKDILGRDLITDDFIAVFELVKNSYDAYATEVDIYFENIGTEKARIIIKDNGKGMSYTDLISKWLFVAYSAKKDGKEDDSFDYRDNINTNRPFAGAKGIGRFSCDRLGRKLTLETTKLDINSVTEVLVTDWEKFEKNLESEFIDISVYHETIEKSNYGLKHGTILIIEELRGDWNRGKYLKLKDSLAKLINPHRGKGDPNFKIFFHVKDEISNDEKEHEKYQKVNGEVENFIFDALEIKTTKVISSISEDGKYILTSLIDGGTLIYQIKETNKFERLSNIDYSIFYLNRSAKITFTKKMGVNAVNYGHIFLYKNGFRIYPYGEPGEDPLKIDARKAQGYGRYLGTREIIGQIEIFSDSDQLKETSSRGDGLIKTETYYELVECFWEVLKKLEKYVVDIQKWGLGIEDDFSYSTKSRISDLIASLTESNDIIDFKVPDNFIEILQASQSRSAESIVKNLEKIALKKNDGELFDLVEKASEKLKEIQQARENAEKEAENEKKRAKEAIKKLEEKISENLFLKSINTTEFQEVIALLHHIGIYAGTIDNNLKGIALRVQNSITITKEELNDIIRNISFETKKILNVVAFATKANFKLKTEEIELDLNEYIKEYIQNIIPTITDKSLQIDIHRNTLRSFTKKIKPIELNIVIDNIVNNAKKAGAKRLDIIIDENKNNELMLAFVDDGSGIPSDIINKIYDFGFTTTDGSGIGLFHVKEILTAIKANIKAINNENKGVTFIIEFK